MRKFMLLVLGTLLAASGAAAADDQPARQAPTSIFTFEPLETPDSDGELTRLLKQRYNAAGAELAEKSLVYLGGRLSLSEVAASLERFAKAGCELNQTPAEQIQHLEKALRAAKNLEAIVRAKVSYETEPGHALKHATVVRLGLEIQLHRARELAKTAALTK